MKYFKVDEKIINQNGNIKLKIFRLMYFMNLLNLNKLLLFLLMISNLQTINIFISNFISWRIIYLDNFFQIIDLSFILHDIDYETNRALIFGLPFIFIVIFFLCIVVEKKTEVIFFWYFLKLILSILCYTLYIPLVNILLENVICELNKEGVYILKNFISQSCFSARHIPIYFLSIVNFILLFTLSFLFWKFFFDPRIKSKKMDNRYNSDFYLQKFSFVTFFIIYFKIFYDSRFRCFLFVCLCLISLVMTYNFSRNSSFYKDSMNRLMLSISLFILITTIFLIFDYFFKNEDNIYFLLITYFFTLILLFSKKSKKKKREILHLESVKNPQEIINYLYTLMDLMLNKNEIHQINNLEFLIFNHQFFCNENDCLFKNVLTKNIHKKDKYQLQKILKEFFKEYMEYHIRKIKKENCLLVEIKIIYIKFLIEIKKEFYDTFEIIREMEEIIDLSFENQYVLYFYKSEIISKIFILQEDSREQNKWNNSSEEKNIFFEDFNLKLEKVVNLYIEFWNVLKQDQPDFKKFLKTGNDLSNNLKVIKSKSKLFNVSNNHDMSLLLNYSKFLKLILDKKSESESIIDKIREEILNTKKDSRFRLTSFDDLNKINIGISILILTKNNEFSIFKINDHCKKLFGYQKSELKQKNINLVFPDVLKVIYHELLSENNIKTKKKVPLHFITILKKNGYLSPIVLDIQFFENSLNKKTFLILYFYLIKNLKECAFMILNNNFEITNTCMNCQELLGINLFSFMKNTKIAFWIKDFDRVKEELFGNRNAEITIDHKNSLTNKYGNKFTVECITYLIGDNKNYYLLKFAPKILPSRITIHNINCDILRDFDNNHKILQEITFAKKKNLDKNNHLSAKRKISHKKLFKENSDFQTQNIVNQKNKKKFFFKQITLLKLKNEKLFETKFELIDNEDIESKFKEERNKFNLNCENTSTNNNPNDEIVNDNIQKIDSKFKLKKLLNQYNYNHNSLLIFNLSFNLFIFLLLFMIGGKFLYVNYQKEQISKNFSVYQISIKKLMHFLHIANNLETFILSYSYFENLSELEIKINAEQIKYKMLFRIQKINKIRNKINQNNYGCYFNNRNAKIAYMDGSFNFYTIIDLEDVFIGKILEITKIINNKNFESFGSYNETSFFLLNNILNPYLKINLIIFEELEKDLSEKIANFYNISLFCLVCKFLMLIAFIVFFIFFYSKNIKKNFVLLKAFLKLPQKFLNRKLEKIQIYLNSNESKNKNLDETQKINFSIKSSLIDKNHQKKTFKNQKNSFNIHMIFFIFFIIFIISFDIILNFYLFNSKILIKKEFIKNNYLSLKGEIGIMRDHFALSHEILKLNIPIHFDKSNNLIKEKFPNFSNFLQNFFYYSLQSNSDPILFEKIETSFFLSICDNKDVYNSPDILKECKDNFQNQDNIIGINYLLTNIYYNYLDFKKKIEENLFNLKDFNIFQNICELNSLSIRHSY